MTRSLLKLAPDHTNVGFGTMQFADDDDPSALFSSTLTAIQRGVRFLDCAEAYDTTTKHVGSAIKESGLHRSELHITTKLRGLPSDDYTTSVKPRAIKHLTDLGIEYVDLLLMHWPGPGDCDLTSNQGVSRACDWAWFDANVDQAWINMQRLKDEGLAKSIGVSNFYLQHLCRLAAPKPLPPLTAPLAIQQPEANQVYLDVTHQEPELLSYMRDQGIQPIGYRVLSFLPVVEMVGAMGDECHTTLQKLAADASSTAAISVHQLVVGWFARQGVHVLFKSKSERHIDQILAAPMLLTNESTKWAGEHDTTMQSLNKAEMVVSCGGQDDTAMLFSAMTAPPTKQQKQVT